MPKTDSIADFIPEKSYDLIEYLAQLYPPRCIEENESAEHAQRYAGASELVSQLKQWKNDELGIEDPSPRQGDGRVSAQTELSF